MAKKQQYKCSKCKAKYWLWHAYQKHQKEKHFNEHVSYFELTNTPRSWGYIYDKENELKAFKKSPTDFAIQMSFLAHIWHENIRTNDLLKEILDQLKKERRIL